jgi:hypothetical protein
MLFAFDLQSLDPYKIGKDWRLTKVSVFPARLEMIFRRAGWFQNRECMVVREQIDLGCGGHDEQAEADI